MSEKLKVAPQYYSDHKTLYALDEFGYERKDYLEEIQDLIELMMALNNRGYRAKLFEELFEDFARRIEEKLNLILTANETEIEVEEKRKAAYLRREKRKAKKK